MLFLLIPSEKATASRQTDDNSFQTGKRYELSIPGNDPVLIETSTKDVETLSLESTVSHDKKANDIEPLENLSWQTVTVRSGDSLGKIFKRSGFGPSTTYKVINAKGDHSKLLKKILVGDTIKLATNDNKELVSLEYPMSKTETLFINLTDEGYQSRKDTKTVESRETFAFGVIKSSFWAAAIEAGLQDKQIIGLANVFGWDIDFALDIREGDSFHVVYENLYIDGDYIGSGKILAAEFINQNESFQAIRFTDDQFYTPDGKSMKKAFLRAPVNFKYISSNFKPKRFHPVQKRWKAHRGIDYAAKTGTPVVASGNGKVTHSTYNKYNGNYVFIQHGNNIVTKYLHFSKRAVKAGQRVKQGQVIGYVGATGLAAGAHLHYEFLLNGVHRNPRTVKLPDALPIDKKYKREFDQLAKLRQADLLGAEKALLSMLSSSHEKNQSKADD